MEDDLPMQADLGQLSSREGGDAKRVLTHVCPKDVDEHNADEHTVDENIADEHNAARQWSDEHWYDEHNANTHWADEHNVAFLPIGLMSAMLMPIGLMNAMLMHIHTYTILVPTSLLDLEPVRSHLVGFQHLQQFKCLQVARDVADP